MAIYQRDNINYGGMLGNAMANRANYLQRRYDRVAQMGQNWGNAVQQGGKTVQDAMFKIAGNYYDQDKLAAQQQFQHDEALLRAQEAAKKQAEQNAWQAAQNDLSRASTERIASENRIASKEQVLAEKQAQNVMHYEIAQGALNSIADEIMRTDDPAKLAQLYRQRDEQVAKMQYYGANLPENYPGRQNPFAGYQGFQLGMGKGSTEAAAAPEVPAETPKVETVANQMAGLVAEGKAASKSGDIQKVIDGLSALDTSKLNDTQRSELKSQISTLKANLTKALKAEARYAEGMKKYNAAKSALERRQIAEEYGLKI